MASLSSLGECGNNSVGGISNFNPAYNVTQHPVQTNFFRGIYPLVCRDVDDKAFKKSYTAANFGEAGYGHNDGTIPGDLVKPTPTDQVITISPEMHTQFFAANGTRAGIGSPRDKTLADE